jgi:hypothetical protein
MKFHLLLECARFNGHALIRLNTRKRPDLNVPDPEDQCSRSHLDYITDKEESSSVSHK